LPTITGAPLNANLKTGMSVKDILPAGSLPSTCTNPDNLTEFNRTLTRLAALKTDIVAIEQWHYAIVNSDGSFTILGDASDALSDAEVTQYINAAHSAGFKVIMNNQLQGFIDSSNNPISSPPGNTQNYQAWVAAFKTYMLNRAAFFQSLGVDYWEMGCNGCVYGDSGDNSASAISIFQNAYSDIIPLVSAIYAGKKYIYGNPNLLNSTILSGVDFLQTGVWNSTTYTAATEANVSVANYLPNMASGVSSLSGYNKPLIINLGGFQSRSNALSAPGYEEETMCTNYIGTTTYTSSCIQQQTTSDFSIQAIVIEAEFEYIAAQQLPGGSIVLMSDYWQTDFMNQNNQGPTFPNIGSTIRNKPAELVVDKWFHR
jgi:hypothetical protein